MAKKYKVMPYARLDLREILAYISKDNPVAARRIKNEFSSAFQKLAENPYIGHIREDLTDRPIRFWNLYSYMVIYKPEVKPLEIIRVLSGYRDIPNMM